MTVYDPTAFTALTETRWDDNVVRAAAREIVADADDAYRSTRLWPADEWDAWQTPTPLKTLYVGAAGVIYALDALRCRGDADSRVDLAEASQSTLDAWRREPDLPPRASSAARRRASTRMRLSAAATIWRAGAHGDEKGAGICHGTAGNGYALLMTFERTQDEQWLGRARAFAVPAVEQTARLRRSRGRGRYSLWTGDLGVALFASDCLVAGACYPIFDGWD